MSFSKYTRIGVKYVTTITNGNLDRDLHEQALLSNDSSNLSYTGASEEGNIDMGNFIKPRVPFTPTDKKSKMSEDKTALQSSSKSSKSGSTDRLPTD